jgi:effector-binding domain-containing protein
MFRIGEFSRSACVTIDTLRHYDALGLLKPAEVDSFTGYRYYTANQLQIDRLASPASPVTVRQIKAVAQMAATIVTGDFYQKVEGLTPAYQAIGRWVEEHGYRIAGAPRELYYGSPQTGDFTAEIQFPVEKQPHHASIS